MLLIAAARQTQLGRKLLADADVIGINITACNSSYCGHCQTDLVLHSSFWSFAFVVVKTEQSIKDFQKYQ